MTNDNPQPVGYRLPKTDFNAVRSGQATPPRFIDVDLTNARSLAAGTQMEIPLSGNVLYIDVKSSSGNATIRFEDTTNSGVPFTIYPGSVFPLIGYTKIGLENTAQPGMTMRLVYGVDQSFVPSNAAGVTLLNSTLAVTQSGVWTISGILGQLAQRAAGGLNALAIADQGDVYATSYTANAGMTGNTAANVIAAASNTNGYRLVRASFHWSGAVNYNNLIAILAKATAPATTIDGNGLASAGVTFTNGPIASSDFNSARAVLERPLLVPSGLRLDFITLLADSQNVRSALYTLL